MKKPGNKKLNIRTSFSPGSFACHEALHMTLYFAEAIEEQLSNHQSIIFKPKWRRLAGEAADKLQELYQEIGKEHL